MEAADSNLDAARGERSGEIERPRELVRLHANHHDHARAGILDQSREAFRANARVRLVEGVHLPRDVLAENLAPGAIAGQAVERRKRVRWDRRAEPLDDIAVVVVVRRFDEDEAEATGGA